MNSAQQETHRQNPYQPGINQWRFKAGMAGLLSLAGFQRRRLILSSILAVIGEGSGIAVYFIFYRP
jgi:hypothetical protein